MTTGRPTSYSQEIVEASWDYLENYNTKHQHAIPSLVGLCKVINRAKTTLYRWAEEEDKQFKDIVEAINEFQQFELINSGLKSEFNPTIAKLLLHKHGYSDKQETELSGSNTNPLGIEITYAGIKSSGKREPKKPEVKSDGEE